MKVNLLKYISYGLSALLVLVLVASTVVGAVCGRDVFLIPSMVIIAVGLTTMRKTGRRENHA